jgi:ribonuclease P protein component
VLPAGSRLTHRDEFASTVRRGRRVGRPRLVVHLYVPSPELPAADVPAPVVTDPAPRAGFVVSRAVGGSVVRHRVTRRLRHLVAPRLAMLPPGSRLVVRALPPAADAPSSVLADDLDHGLRSALWRTNSGRTNSGRTGSGRTGVPVGGRS